MIYHFIVGKHGKSGLSNVFRQQSSARPLPLEKIEIVSELEGGSLSVLRGGEEMAKSRAIKGYGEFPITGVDIDLTAVSRSSFGLFQQPPYFSLKAQPFTEGDEILIDAPNVSTKGFFAAFLRTGEVPFSLIRT